MRFFFAIAIVAFLLTGCGTNQSTPQFSGTVSAFCPNDIQAKVSTELKSGKVNGGMYSNSGLSGWKVDIAWRQSAVKNKKATYRFSWSYTIDSEEPVTGASDITFDGKNRIVTKVDNRLTISLDPRSFREMHPGAKEAVALTKPAPAG